MSNSHLENTMNKTNEIPDDKKDDDVRSDSDESISTEDLNILQNQVGETFKKQEEEPPAEKEIEEVKPDKPKKLSKKELQDLLKEYDDVDEPIQQEETPVKKKKGRPKKTEEEKNAKKTIIKEKVIYMVKDDDTDEYKKIKNPKPLSKRHLKKIEEDKALQEKELEIGKRIVRTKKGKEDKRSTKERTEKQIAHSKKLVDIMAKRRAEKKEASNKQQKDNIKQAVVEIVTKPIEHVKAELPNYKPPQKSVYQQYNDFFG